jgi:aspartate dehydrogenase
MLATPSTGMSEAARAAVLVGVGAIGGAVLDGWAQGRCPGIRWVGAYDQAPSPRARERCRTLGIPLLDSLEDLWGESAGLVVECASQAAARQVLPPALASGRDVVSTSVGAFADDAFFEEVAAAARAGGGRLWLPGGAVGGLDLMAALRVRGVRRVRLTTRKPPAAIAGVDPGLKEAREVFRGPAREAAARYPQNLNVAATLALAGLGLDATEVVLVADPAAERNLHCIEIEAEAGRYRIELDNYPSPDNPKSSALTADSVLALLQSLGGRIFLGGFRLL